MITALTLTQLYVLDQDEALDFYVGKLGMEKRNDFDLGFMRWLTIGVPGQPLNEVLLELPDVQLGFLTAAMTNRELMGHVADEMLTV